MPTPKELAALAAAAPLPEDFYAAFLSKADRDWLKELREIEARCAALHADARADADRGEERITISPEALASFVEMAKALAQGWRFALQDKAFRVLLDAVRNPPSRGRGRPRVTKLGSQHKEKGKGGRPPLTTHEQRRRYLTELLNEKAEHESRTGKKITDKAFLRIRLQRESGWKPGELERFLNRMAKEFSDWRHEFEKGLRKKRSKKSGNPPGK